MTLDKLSIPPDQSAYSVTDGVEVISVKLDGGASRYRRDVLGATSNATVQWTVGPDVYQYLRAFYKTATASGSLPFLIDLLLDNFDLTEHKAYFIPGSMRLQSQKGHEYTVSAKLEVIPISPDDDFNNAIIAVYGKFSNSAFSVLNEIAIFANITLPRSI